MIKDQAELYRQTAQKFLAKGIFTIKPTEPTKNVLQRNYRAGFRKGWPTKNNSK